MTAERNGFSHHTQPEAQPAYEFPFASYPTPEWTTYEFYDRAYRVVITEEVDKDKAIFDWDGNLPLDPRNEAHVAFAQKVLGVYGGQMAREATGHTNLSVIRLGPPLDRERLREEGEKLAEKKEIPYAAEMGIGYYLNRENIRPIRGYDPEYEAQLKQSVADFLAKESS